MARKSRSHSRHRRHHTRKQRGGNYSSASTYGMYVNGTGSSQFDRTFSLEGPYAGRLGTEYIGAQGQGANQPSIPSAENLNLIQNAGGRYRKHKKYHTKSRKGGFYASVLNQAIVPGTILALQQSYGNRKNGNSKRSRKYRR